MRRALAVLAAASILIFLASALSASAAFASQEQETFFSDNTRLLADPVGTLQRLRLLGVERVRVFLAWQDVAPRPSARRRPRDFRAGDPAAYPAAAWAPWDAIVRDATADGIGIDLDLVGGAPLWATPPGAPTDKAYPNWQPSAAEFGGWVRAVGTRYSGAYDAGERRLDPGSAGDLPAVRFWSVWNEPNYGPSLAPQGVPGNLRLEHSPAVYRGLLDAAWTSLRATGHGADTILWGELAPRGAGFWGVFSGMKPLIFLRALFCVDAAYRPLAGAAATERGCPARPDLRAFGNAHPALFHATGVALHPYMRWYPPTFAESDANYAALGELGRVEATLDRLQRVYGSSLRPLVFDTEFGYMTSPPKHPTGRNPWLGTTTAALYMNWAEYLSWHSGRMQSFMQYLLNDPVPASAATDWGGYASGLLGYGGQQKLTYSAFRLPLFLPVTVETRGTSLLVWGCVRPAHFAQADTGRPQSVAIQFAPSGSRSFRTIQTLPITDPRGYFTTRVSFPSSGAVKLEWSYPADDPGFAPGYAVFSRTAEVTVH